MLKINIKTIPHKEHRFTTVGDWYDDASGAVTIVVSDFKKQFPELLEKEAFVYEFLVVVHEIVEWAWCKFKGVTTKEADEFDAMYENMYQTGEKDKSEEPGYDKRCPYYFGHVWGDRMSWVFNFLFFHVNWKKYNYYCDKLCD